MLALRGRLTHEETRQIIHVVRVKGTQANTSLKVTVDRNISRKRNGHEEGARGPCGLDGLNSQWDSIYTS